jgi:hypothetical protein
MPETPPKILIQLDPDPHASSFDAVVAIDAGVDRLLQYGGVRPEQVRPLVHGAVFTRGPADLANTAIFVGGSDVAAGEALLKAAVDSFFDIFRVSVMLDANGANTTAAAAVVAATRSVGDLAGLSVAVLGGTGPVGQRVARLCARSGAKVALGSRSLDRAKAAAEAISATTGAEISPFVDLADIAGADVVFSAGAAGAVTLPVAARRDFKSLRALIDLNAVPPLGIEGVSATAKDKDLDGVRAWGALGVGSIKMKVHRQAIRDLFSGDSLVLDAESIHDLARRIF